MSDPEAVDADTDVTSDAMGLLGGGIVELLGGLLSLGMLSLGLSSLGLSTLTDFSWLPESWKRGVILDSAGTSWLPRLLWCRLWG